MVTTPLPIDVENGDGGHADLHNLVNALVNTLATQVDTWLDPTSRTIRGSGAPGNYEPAQANHNLVHNALTGFLVHLMAGASSGAGTALVGLGGEDGDADLLVLSVKSRGKGLNASSHAAVGQQPLIYLNAYNVAQALYAQIHSKAGEPTIIAALGEAYPDGVTVAGQDTFDSATANFVVGDVGSVLRPTTRSPTFPGVSAGAYPTIIARISATRVQLSAPIPSSETGIKFTIASRVPATSQKLLSVLDHDAAVLLQVLRSGVNIPTLIAKVLTVGDTATPGSLRVNGAAVTSRDLTFQTSGNARWILRCENTAEAGSNAGSNFQVISRTDAGGTLALALEIKRATGQIIVQASPIKEFTASTAGRPAAATAGAGAHMFDTTLGKPIWSNGAAWVDATGATV